MHEEQLADVGRPAQRRDWGAIAERVANWLLAVGFSAMAAFFVFACFASGMSPSRRIIGLIMFCAGIGGSFWFDVIQPISPRSRVHPPESWWMRSLEGTCVLTGGVGLVLAMIP